MTTWAGAGVPRTPRLGDGFTEDQRTDLAGAMSGAVYLSHPLSPVGWAIRVNRSGTLEFLATQSDRKYDVIATLTVAGAWGVGNTVTALVGLAEPGR